MARKFERGELPPGHTLEDFECFGPPATADGQFDTCKICDMGCFTQDGKDSNKYYHAAMAKSKKNQKWHTYFEWGRTGANKVDFLFHECDSEDEAREIFADQVHSKNDKRGEWVTIAGKQTLRAKAGKDCYLVRRLARRDVGLPDGKKIVLNDGAKQAAAPVASTPTKKASGKATPKADSETIRLMRDLNVATINYTKDAVEGGNIPMQAAIEEARDYLTEAQKRIAKIGHDIDVQVADKDMRDLTNLVYSKIPKKKARNAQPKEWLLTSDNILGWQSDLDAFESALAATEVSQPEIDPFDGMRIDMSWIDPKSSLGAWLAKWAPTGTRGKHGYGRMNVKNLWKVARHGDEKRLYDYMDGLTSARIAGERPLHQPDKRPDIADAPRSDLYHKTNTCFLFHGTRSVNVSGILRKSLLLPNQLVGVVITGAMFGPGLYFADDWMKSAGYTSLSSSHWSRGAGGVQGRGAFMFVCDVVLGNTYTAPTSDGYTEAPRGHHSVFGKAGHSKFDSYSRQTLQNNEWIVYKSQQHMLRYLIEFTT